MLRWEFEESAGSWRPTALAAGRWRLELPARVRALPSRMDAGEIERYRRDPRSAPRPPFVLGTAEGEGWTAVADESGVLLLSTSDGEVLLDAPLPPGGEDRLWFDAGRFRVAGLGEGPARGGMFFDRLGGQFLYFNGSTLALIDPERRAVASRAVYVEAEHGRPARDCLGARAIIPLDGMPVEIEGFIALG